MKTDSPLEELQIPVVTRQDIEALRDEAHAAGDARMADIARRALGETNICVPIKFAHPVDARDECVRIITAARRTS
jgi:hypothetical protein